MSALFNSMKPPARALLCATMVCGSPLEGTGEDWWPQFRGPNASGVATGAKPPWKIGPDSSVLWKIDVPWSPSSPTVWGNRILLTTFAGGELQTRCYHREDGSLLWRAGVKPDALEDYHRQDGSPAASTVATDGRHAVSYFGSFGVVCYDLEGKELWRQQMPVAKSAGKFGTGNSPIIVDGAVILIREDPAESKLLALDVTSGKKLWEAPRPGLFGGFGTPVVWEHGGGKELVVPGSLMLKSYAPESGEELWSVGGLSAFSCTTPVIGGGRLFYGSYSPGGLDNPWPAWDEFRQGMDQNADGAIDLKAEIPAGRLDYIRALDVDDDGRITEGDWIKLQRNSSRGANQLIAVQAGGRGDVTDSHVRWVVKKGLPYVPSPLFYDGRIYMVKDGGLLSSIDPDTGEAHYSRERLGTRGDYYASPVAADGRIYVASLGGVLSVIEAGGAAPKILHQADFNERILATPAIIGDKLYLRTEGKLYAFGSGPD